MPRSHRNFTTDDRFHIINHGIDSQDLFSIDDDWALFESLMGRACSEHGFRATAYALMSNHYHLLVDLTDCDDRSAVSAAIGVMQATYASYFNERTNRRGPLFEPRFLSSGVSGDTACHRTVRYIHRNPIPICGPRALGNYRWSSLPVLVGRRPSPDWLDCSLFVPNDPLAHLADLADCRIEDLRPAGPLPPQQRTTIDRIDDAVARSLNRADDRLRRAITAMLALDLRVMDVVDLAHCLDRTTASVRQLAARTRQRRLDDPAFASLVARVEQHLVDDHR